MPAIPINNALIDGAVPYPASYTPFAMNICRAPPEGAVAIPLQYIFSANPVWLTDLSGGIPLVSQVSSMYIDALNSATSVFVIFADTGYQVEVPAGKSLLCPVFTGRSNLPKFYVVINSGGIPTSDIVNITLLNFFIPEFASG